MANAGRRRLTAGLAVALVLLIGIVVLRAVGGGSGGGSPTDALGSSTFDGSGNASSASPATTAPSPTPTRTASRAHTPSTATGAGSGSSGGGGAVALPPPPKPTYRPEPAPSATAHPGAAPLRLSDYKNDPFLTPPGLAMDRGQLRLTAAAPLDFDTDPLSRPVDVSGTPTLRLHVTHDGAADIPLTLSLIDLAPDGSTTTLASRSYVIPAATAAAGPSSNADTSFSTIRHRIAQQHVLRLHVALASLTDSVTLYLGALPGEAEGNSTNDQIKRTEGGSNPSRLTVPVTRTEGAFAP